MTPVSGLQVREELILPFSIKCIYIRKSFSLHSQQWETKWMHCSDIHKTLFMLIVNHEIHDSRMVGSAPFGWANMATLWKCIEFPLYFHIRKRENKCIVLMCIVYCSIALKLWNSLPIGAGVEDILFIFCWGGGGWQMWPNSEHLNFLGHFIHSVNLLRPYFRKFTLLFFCIECLYKKKNVMQFVFIKIKQNNIFKKWSLKGRRLFKAKYSDNLLPYSLKSINLPSSLKKLRRIYNVYLYKLSKYNDFLSIRFYDWIR